MGKLARSGSGGGGRFGGRRVERLEGSAQQEAFYLEMLEGSGHVLLEARAGSGKSTSACQSMARILERMPGLPMRYCCFNAKNADEFITKAPRGSEVGTMHSFGYQLLRRTFRVKDVDEAKTYRILDDFAAADSERLLPRKLRRCVSAVVRLAKNFGILPDDDGAEDTIQGLTDDFGVDCGGRDAEVAYMAREVLAASMERVDILDFDDMIWLPVAQRMEDMWPDTAFLFVDECQDLNPLQHRLVGDMCARGRICVIGDPFQSIYAFRGADANSVSKLRDGLGAKSMPLTVSFRCPRSHVELARKLVPDFEAAPDAADGVVRQGDRDLINEAVPGDMVLCRLNGPLVSICLQFIGAGIPSMMLGRGIGKSLLAVCAKLGDPGTMSQFNRAVSAWLAGEMARLAVREGTEGLREIVSDQAACLWSLARSCSSPVEVPRTIDRLFGDRVGASRVVFSSVHRAKGAEARRVFYLQVPYPKGPPGRPWELAQRRNLEYVALTRSLEKLVLCSFF